MESRMHTGAGVLQPMEFTSGPMGLSKSFAAFSQDILDRYAIWEKYPWSDAVIRYLEQEKQEEASEEKEPSSFFVTLKLIKIYLENEQGKEKAAGDVKETGEAKAAGKAKEAEHETLTLRIEAELRSLKAGYDKYFGILERLYREGRQMPQDERFRIWGLLEQEAGRRRGWENGRKEDGRKLSKQVSKTVALWGRGLITPYALGAPAIRLRRMVEGHGRMPDSKALFQKSVERQQREFYTGIVRSHVVREMARQAEHRLGRKLNPSEYQALKDYGDSLERTELAFYASGSDSRLYQETAEKGKPNGTKAPEEMVRLLSELPDFISRTAVQELYAEDVRTAGKEGGEPKEGVIEVREQSSAMPEGYGENLVYRMENQNFLSLAELWKQSGPEEKTYLLQRIPQAVKQAASLWEESSQGTGSFGQENESSDREKILKTIIERLETAGSPEADREPEMGRSPVDVGITEEIGRLLLELPDFISRTAVQELYAEDVRTAGKEGGEPKEGVIEVWEQSSAMPEGYGENLVYRIENQAFLPLAELWKQSGPEERNHLLQRIPQAVRQAMLLWEESGQGTGNSHQKEMLESILERMEAAGGRKAGREPESGRLPADAGMTEEIGRLLLKLPDFISRTAVQELYAEDVRTAGKEGGEPKEGVIEVREQSSAMPEGYGENLIYRMENQTFLSLAELWEQSGPEERNHLLQRISQTIRQTIFPEEESGQGTSGPRRKEMLEAIVERMEAVGDREAVKSREAGREPKSGRLPVDAGITEEVGRLLLELPDWISRTAAAELYTEGVKNDGKGEAPENGAMEALEAQSSGSEGYRENLVYRMEGQDSLRLSTLWEQSTPEERNHLLRRIPGAVGQAAFLWEESGREPIGPRQEKVLQAIVERLKTVLGRMEAFQASGAVPHPEASGSSGTRRGTEIAISDNGAVFEKRFSEEEQHVESREQVLLTALTWLAPHAGWSLLAAGTKRAEPEIFYRMRPQIQREESVSSFAYPNPWERAIVYAARASQPSGIRKKEEGMQAIQELESRISRQEYIIRQEKMEREELQRRMKEREDKEDTLWQSENMKIASRQGSDLSPDMLARLKEHLRKERIRYGAD